MEQQIQGQELQQNQGKKGKKSSLLLVLLLLLVTITVGYAVLSATLNINGTSTVVNAEWCVGPKCGDDACEDISSASCTDKPLDCKGENCIILDCDANPSACNCDAQGNCDPGAIDCTTNPEKCLKPNCEVTATETCACTENKETCVPIPQIWMKGNTISFEHTLTKPGQVFTFNATYKNGGDIDAKVSSVLKSELNSTAQNYLTYTVTYADGSAIQEDDVLAAGASAEFKVTVAYKNVSALPDAATVALINETAQGHRGATSSFTVTYEQK